MLKFKDFLLKEDLGIGPEGTSKNPSITNYMDSLKKDKKDILQQKKVTPGRPEEKDRLNNLLNQKQQEIAQTKLLNNPLTTTPSEPASVNVLSSEPSVVPTLPTDTPSSKESAFNKLIRGKATSTVDALTLSPGMDSPNVSIYSGYQASQKMPGSMTIPKLNTEIGSLGKTSKTLRL